MSADPRRLDWIDGLRGLAAFYVLCSHVWYQVWPAVPWPHGHGRFPDDAVAAFTGWLYYGHFAVVVFICLSGFCLMRPALQDGGRLRGGAAAFLRRRAWRLLPPYYAALALSLALCLACIGERTGSQWDIAVPVTAAGVVSHLLLLNDLLGSTQVNYVYWSIALELHLSLAFPLWVRAWRRFGGRATVAVTMVLVYGAVLGLEAAGVQDVPPQFIGLVACFVIGMAAAALARRVAAASAAAAVAASFADWAERAGWCGWAVAALLCAAWGHALAEQRFAVLDLLGALSTAALLVAACSGRRGPFMRVASAGPLVACGRFSYSLYLTHAPLLQLLWLYAVRPWAGGDLAQFLGLALVALPACLAFAWLFHQVAEKPFLRPRHRRWWRAGERLRAPGGA